MNQTTTSAPSTNCNGKARSLICASDWSATELGDMAGWPQSLKTAVEMLLHVQTPMLLLWGDNHRCFYNDAFLSGTGNAGIDSFMPGKCAPEIFSDNWTGLQQKLSYVITVKEAVTDCNEVFGGNCDYSPVFNEAGIVGGVYIMCTDFGKKTTPGHENAEGSAEAWLRTTRDQMQASHRIYDAITAATPDLIYVIDLNYKFLYANKALLEMWGRTWEESIGQGLLALGYEPWHAEMHEREIDEVAATKKMIRGTVSFPHATLGKRIYDYIFAPVLNEQGEVVAIAGTTRDISELKHAEEALKQSEEQFRLLTQSLPQLIWTARADGYTDFYNEKWYQYTGSTPEISSGEGWGQYIHPAHLDELQRKWQNSLQTGTPIIFEFQLLGADGIYNWFYVHGNPIRDDEGIIRKWVGALTNIEEQKAVEEQLEQMVHDRTRELQRSNGDLQQFAHVASHDLREPVRKVKTFASLLETDPETMLSAKGKQYLEKIYNATSRMDIMINGVLNYSTMTNTEELLTTVDLNEIIRNIETDLELSILQKNVNIVYDHLPTLKGAPVLIHQLFYNLINNSLKFSKEDVTPEISITSEPLKDNDQDMVRICVRDNGIGFSQDLSEKIFMTFTRLHAKDRYEGTGLGLALCKKIVERHGGTISAAAEENVGAVFTITLPVNL